MDLTSLTPEQYENLRRKVEYRMNVEKARNDLETFCGFVTEAHKTSAHIKLICEKLAKVEKGEITRLLISLPPQHGKQVDHKVPVLTKSGWKRHGDLQVGDYVFHPDGNPVKVLWCSEPSDEKMIVRLFDGAEVKVHPKHEWTVYDRSSHKWKTVETRWLAEQGLCYGPGSKNRSRFILPFQESLNFPHQNLPLHPYVLGAWLGDGTSKKDAVTYHPDDVHVSSRIRELGFEPRLTHVHRGTGIYTTHFEGLKFKLIEAGVLGDKHVPENYLFSSREQRLQLLAGLIDTDGSVDIASRRVRFINTNKRLVDSVEFLVRSFGWRPSTQAVQPCRSSSGIEGKQVVYYLGFSPDIAIPTKVPRKAIPGWKIQKRRRSIKEIVPCDPSPGKCIQVDREDGLYLVGDSLIPTHNSQTASRAFPLWFMGRNPNKNIIFSTYNQEFANEFGRHLRNGMNESWFREIFPGCESSRDAASVKLVQTTKKGTFYAIGAGSSITGRGAHLILIDDPIKNAEEADSETRRESIKRWWETTVVTRQRPGTAIIVIATRWHEDDLIGYILGKNDPTWEYLSIPAISEGEGDPLGRKVGELLWPEHFGADFYEKQKAEMGSFAFNALYQQRPADAAGNIFKREWWRPWKHYTKRGEAILPAFDYTIMSLDTAYTMEKRNDYSVMQIWGLFERETDQGSENGVMLIANVRGRWEFHELRQRAKMMYQEYQPELVLIEKASSGIPLAQELQRIGIPVTPKTPRGSKEVRAAAIMPVFESGKVWYKLHDLEDAALIDEAASFPNGKHDDQVDAMVVALQYFRVNGYLKAVLDRFDDEERDTEVKSYYSASKNRKSGF